MRTYMYIERHKVILFSKVVNGLWVESVLTTCTVYRLDTGVDSKHSINTTEYEPEWSVNVHFLHVIGT